MWPGKLKVQSVLSGSFLHCVVEVLKSVALVVELLMFLSTEQMLVLIWINKWKSMFEFRFN